MEMKWFDEAVEHVEKYYIKLPEEGMFKESYAPIPHFLSDTSKVHVGWLENAKKFVRYNWVAVGDDVYAKPGSLHTKQGRLINSLENNHDEFLPLETWKSKFSKPEAVIG